MRSATRISLEKESNVISLSISRKKYDTNGKLYKSLNKNIGSNGYNSLYLLSVKLLLD